MVVTFERHCYCPLRIQTPYMTPYEARSMREFAALRMVWASAAWIAAVEMFIVLACVGLE
jgi:hypothetical protein